MVQKYDFNVNGTDEILAQETKKKKISKTNEAWNKIFSELPILDKVSDSGIYEISANEIKAIGNREPRLMTKFDHKNNLPFAFKKNKLSILPNSRGTYLIGDFKAYEDFELDESIKPIKMRFPTDIDSVHPDKISSEAVAMNTAYFSGMIDEVLGSKTNEAKLTLTGRMSSGNMNFKVKNTKKAFSEISVKNSQMEIDATYETKDTISIFEAKQTVPQDFLVRQLYYPYYYMNQFKTDKQIRLFYFTYVNDVFHFKEYQFQDPYEYSSIINIDQKSFILGDTNSILRYDIESLYENIVVDPEPLNERNKPIPFPQADSILRVLDLLEYVSIKKRSKIEITEYYGFAERQSGYYSNVLLYLGWAENNKSIISLTEKGYAIVNEDHYRKKLMMIISSVLSKRVFYEIFGIYLSKNELPDKRYIAKIIDERIETVNLGTLGRRASTVQNWLRWIVNLID